GDARRAAQRARPLLPAARRRPDLRPGRRARPGHRGARRHVVRRPARSEPAARIAHRGQPLERAGPVGPAERGALHRPARGEVRPARAGVARLQAQRTGLTVLRELHIRDLGVIEDAVLELVPGLTVLTGETGAGKTMVVSGLGLVLGGRADPDL